MTTPRVEIPSLRAYLGGIACRATTTTTTVRALRKLQGALTQSDTDVQDVVNELVDCVDALAVEAATSTDQRASSKIVDVISHEGAGGTETVKTYTYSGTTKIVDAYEVDVAMITDDGLDAYVAKFIRAFSWDGGSNLYAVGDSTAVYEIPSGGATTAAFDISTTGANVQMKVTGSSDWRWAVSVRRTRMGF